MECLHSRLDSWGENRWLRYCRAHWRSVSRSDVPLASDFPIRHAGRRIFALTVVITFGYSATYIALPVISRDRFGSDLVLTLGIMAYTVGGIVGAVVIFRWRPHHIGWIALAGNGAYALAPLALAFAFDQWFILGTYVLVGIGVEFFNVPWFTAIQREVPADMVARVSSVDFLVSYGLAPIGLAALAPAIHTFGMTAVLVTCAIMCIAATAVAMLPAASRTFRTPAVSP